MFSRSYLLTAVSATLALGTLLTACDSTDSDAGSFDPIYSMVTFEDTGITLAGPTSYGANLYSNYTGAKFTTGEVAVNPQGTKMQFGIAVSPYTGQREFYGGGMVLSQWNYRTTPPSQTPEDWWKTSQNQCSVYNLASTNGANRGAGANGSNTFAVINGCNQSKYNASLSDNCAEISFSNSAEFIVLAVQVCPTSYVYGNITEANPFGCATSLELADGYFCVNAYGYDAAGNPTNGGEPVTFYFCDYRTTTRPNVPYVTGWNTWTLEKLGKVNKIRFDFDGSDVGQWGLNTPTYACLDDFLIQLKY